MVKLDAEGKLTLLYRFAGTPDGDDPYAGLLRDKAGNLYGTTQYGGINGGYGTVFKLDPKGKLSLLHSFAGTPDGVNPLAGLLMDAAGNLYGTTYYGGTNGGFETVFKLNTKGKLTLLHSFAGMPDGQNPYSRLIRDVAGNLYGTTFYGGTTGYGSVFKSDTAGKLTVLHSFKDAPDGAPSDRWVGPGQDRQSVRHHQRWRRSQLWVLGLRNRVQAHPLESGGANSR